MKQWIRRVPQTMMSAVILTVLVSCAGNRQPTNYYLLKSTSIVAKDTPPQRNPAIGVGPITLPQYLDRPQIVIQASDYRIEISEFHQWAESLHDNLSRVIAENLTTMIPTPHLTLFPWKGSTRIDYKVAINITQFDVTPDSVAIVARWHIASGQDKSVLSERTSSLKKPVTEDSYEAKVAALSNLIEDLSFEIAEVVNALELKHYHNNQ